MQRAKDTYLVYHIRASLAKYCESLAFLGQSKNSTDNEVQTEQQRLQRLSQTSAEGLKDQTLGYFHVWVFPSS